MLRGDDHSLDRTSKSGSIATYRCSISPRLIPSTWILYLSLKKWCNVKPEDLKTEIARFENMILDEGARLKKEGKQGLEILPGVKTLLDSVGRSVLHPVTGCGAEISGRDRFRKRTGRSLLLVSCQKNGTYRKDCRLRPSFVFLISDDPLRCARFGAS